LASQSSRLWTASFRRPDVIAAAATLASSGPFYHTPRTTDMRKDADRHDITPLISHHTTDNDTASVFEININQMAVIVWNATIQYSARSGPAICAQAVYFLHSTMPSVTCLRLSDASVICCVTYFQFPIQSAFLPCPSPRQHIGVRGLPNIGHRTLPKIWVGTFLVRSVQYRGMILNRF